MKWRPAVSYFVFTYTYQWEFNLKKEKQLISWLTQGRTAYLWWVWKFGLGISDVVPLSGGELFPSLNVTMWWKQSEAGHDRKHCKSSSLRFLKFLLMSLISIKFLLISCPSEKHLSFCAHLYSLVFSHLKNIEFIFGFIPMTGENSMK